MTHAAACSNRILGTSRTQEHEIGDVVRPVQPRAQAVIKRGGIDKHVCHCSVLDLPACQILVELLCVSEHGSHVHHFFDIPFGNIPVE